MQHAITLSQATYRLVSPRGLKDGTSESRTDEQNTKRLATATDRRTVVTTA